MAKSSFPTFVPSSTTAPTDQNLSLSDVTTNDVSTSKHGFAPKGTNIGNFLKDNGTWSAIPATTDASIVISDVTTNNFSITKHGFVPKGTNVGNFLKDDGTWAAVPSGGGGSSVGLSSRTTKTATTVATLASGATEQLTFVGFKGYFLYKITSNYPAWVKIYIDSASATADSSRTEGTDPLPGSGVIAESISTTANQDIYFAPAVAGFNSAGDTTVNIRVTNKDTVSRQITVTFQLLQIEA